jgi:hypothetical protein
MGKRLRKIFIVLLFPGSIWSQNNISEQLWGNFSFCFPQTQKWSLQADLNPKMEVANEMEWWRVDIVPKIEYYPLSWIDLVGELGGGYSHQTDKLKAYEFSPRIGLRFYLLGNLWHYSRLGERIPLSRLKLSTLIRYEFRNLWYNADIKNEHLSRLRVRVKVRLAINNKMLYFDKTFHIFADGEAFANVEESVSEIFSSKLRLRLGAGYRLNYKNRFQVMVIYDLARNTIEINPDVNTIALNFQYKLYF